MTKYYNRQDQGCFFIDADADAEGMYKVYNADGDFLCITDMVGAINVCSALDNR